MLSSGTLLSIIAIIERMKPTYIPFRGPQKQHRVDLRNVHTFVIQIHREDHPHVAADQLVPGYAAFLIAGMAVKRDGGDAGGIEMLGHEMGVLYG